MPLIVPDTGEGKPPPADVDTAPRGITVSPDDFSKFVAEKDAPPAPEFDIQDATIPAGLGAPGVTVSPDDFSNFVAEKDDPQRALSSSLDQALPRSPSAVAETRDISQKTGFPEAAVEASPELLKTEARKAEILGMLSDGNSPVTSQSMSDPNFASIAHDNVEDLAKLEKLSKDVTIGGALGLGVDSLQIGLFGGVEAFSRLAGADTLADLAQKGRERNEAEAARVSPFVKNFLDIRTAGDAADFVKTGLPQIAPSIAAMASAGFTTGAIATALGVTAVAPAALASLAVLSLAWVLGAGGIQSQIQQASPGVKGTEDAAIVGGLGVGLLDAILPGKAGAAFTAALAKKGLLRSLPDLAKRAGTEAAKGAPIEGVTEGAQSLVENTATSGATGIELDSEKLYEDFINQGALGFLGGGAANTVFSITNDVASAKKAVKNEEVVKGVSEKSRELPLSKRDFKASVEFQAKLLSKQGLNNTSISVDKLIAFAELQEDQTSEEFIKKVGLSEQVEQAKFTNGDVRLTQEQFAEFFLSSDKYDSISEDIRLGEGEMTAAEAKEFETSDLPAALEKLVPLEPDALTSPTEAAPVVGDIEKEVRARNELAEFEAGLQAMFQSGKELGQGEKTFESYLVAVQKVADGRVKRELLRENKAALKGATSELDKATVEMRKIVQEEVEQRPAYRALNILKDGGRLDQQAIFESDFLGEPFDIETLDGFPKIGNKKIFGPVKKGEDVFSPDLLAEVTGFKDGNELLKALFKLPPISEVVNEEADLRVSQEKGELPAEVAKIEATIRGLYVDDTAAILTFELNALRNAKKQGRLKPALIKAAARQELQKYALRDISILKFTSAAKRFGEKSGKLLRAGDRAGAAEAKLSQIKNFEMAQETFKTKDRIKKQQKFLRDVAKKPKLGGKSKHDLLPPDYSTAIRGILNSYGLGGEALPQGFDLVAFQAREAEAGVAFKLPPPGDPSVNIKNAPLHEFNSLVNSIKTIENLGALKTKVTRSIEAAKAQELVNALVIQANRTIDPKTARTSRDPVTGVKLVPIKDDVLDRVIEMGQTTGVDFATLGFNMDTLLREQDGWDDLGIAYEAIKGPIDDAISNGYREDQVGFNARRKQMMQDVTNIIEAHYTIEERAKFHRGRDIEGVSRSFTKHEILAILLNSGNAENISALTKGEGRRLSETELIAVRNAVDEKDLDFAQAMWDYNETYWAEISESTIRRKNFRPEKVIAQPFTVKGKTYQGGFYHLAYDGDATAISNAASVDDIQEALLFGSYTSEHVNDDHIEKRKKNVDRAVNLDPFIAIYHLQKVIYDLEVGEAISDSFKILHHRDYKAAFVRLGRQKMWNAMDLWFRSTVTGEIRRGGPVEKFLRNLRSGIGVFALGYSVSVFLLQPLGIISAANLVGVGRITKSVGSTISRMVTEGPLVLREMAKVTPTMDQRSFTQNKEIHDFEGAFNKTWRDVGLPGRAKKLKDITMFMFLIKFQSFADIVIWHAAYAKGMAKFANDDFKAKRSADRAVIRTQGSSNFQERTSVEQGTLSRGINQTETVKIFSLFMVFFAAKTNVVYETIKRNKKKSTVRGAAKLASGLALAYVFETIFAMLIKGQFPDGEDEPAGAALKVGEEILATAAAGVPFVRDLVSAARGFPGGGTIGALGKGLSDLFQQFGQGELDVGLGLAMAKIFGVLRRVPLGQPSKTVKTISKAVEGDEITVLETAMGPRHRE